MARTARRSIDWLAVLVALSCAFAVSAQAGTARLERGRHGDSRLVRLRYHAGNYRLLRIPSSMLPGVHSYAIALEEPSRPTDARGVALYDYGGHTVYHPLVIARYGLDLLNGYRITMSQPYLDRAEVNAQYLVDTAVSRNGALYFPYRFTYELFGDPSDLMRPPWYSGMSQGTALSLFVRLYELTGDQRWQTAANRTFATFEQQRSATEPWFAFVDKGRFLWFEEYPTDPPTQVLNGDIYALVGVYEFALETGTTAARKVYDGGVTTIKNEIDEFRVPGEYSYYSLRVRAQYSSYHDVVVGQLRLLTAMTGDRFFSHEAAIFTADEKKAKKSPTH